MRKWKHKRKKEKEKNYSYKGGKLWDFGTEKRMDL